MASRRKNRAKSAKTNPAKKHAHVQNPLTELISRIGPEIADENCVLFVGGGSSTEKWAKENSFYAAIRAQTSLSGDSGSHAFPAVMQKFCEERDGGHHNVLIREAIRYIEHFLLPGPANQVATEFSRQLATIPFFKVVLTTNWDPLLERALDVLVPITQDRDLGFWDDRKKQVVKIHGCITRPHSIVAAQSDYDACVAANTLLFNKVRDLMATKTFLFTGYSLKDADFREIWDSIANRLGQFSKLAYALDPFATDEDITYWSQRGISIFRMRDTQFLEGLRSHFVEAGLIPSDRLINFLMSERSRIVKIHVKLEQNCDGGFVSAMYQDGLLHELDDLLDSIRLGTRIKQEDFENQLGFMLKCVRDAAQKQKDPVEIAYYTGRYTVINGYLEADGNELPTYFHPYRLTPVRKLVKGTVWKFSKRRKDQPDSEGPQDIAEDHSTREPFFAVCKHCAELLHKR